MLTEALAVQLLADRADTRLAGLPLLQPHVQCLLRVEGEGRRVKRVLSFESFRTVRNATKVALLLQALSPQ
jgi:hypothetical protein